MDKTSRRIRAILEILNSHPGPVSSSEVARHLHEDGLDISERTVRHYLKQMDEAGLTILRGKKGRYLSPEGVAEVEKGKTADKIGFLSARMDQLTYAMSFDLANSTGTVVVNTVVLDPHDLMELLNPIELVFRYGYAMGKLAAILPPGEVVGRVTIPENAVGFTTVCSVTLNGVLLKNGIPTSPRFGGMLELIKSKPARFTDLITYDGTTVDPLEVFIRSGMSNYWGAITTGNGKIGASFREIPADSSERVIALGQKLEAIGLGGIYEIGRSGRSVFGVPVSDGRAGLVLIGGLNPASILAERNVRIQAYALAGLFEFDRLVHYKHLGKQLNQFLRK